MGFIMTLFIGLIAGVIAKFLHPGKNEPKGFLLTMLLGVVGAFVFTFLGQTLGFYGKGDGAGLIGATLGAIIVLVIWNFFSRRTPA
ncbi:GlsB/YeaQ/YmgE family stress response membrane protein [Hyphomonas chukchiensis]|uniref:GlsB/YeaQ/YmgE family stress response membrane protein n=1 Tax=Hyphomonas chukchiensis TaxID=1280947 RepID=UPI0030FBB464